MSLEYPKIYERVDKDYKFEKVAENEKAIIYAQRSIEFNKIVGYNLFLKKEGRSKFAKMPYMRFPAPSLYGREAWFIVDINRALNGLQYLLTHSNLKGLAK